MYPDDPGPDGKFVTALKALEFGEQIPDLRTQCEKALTQQRTTFSPIPYPSHLDTLRDNIAVNLKMNPRLAQEKSPVLEDPQSTIDIGGSSDEPPVSTTRGFLLEASVRAIAFRILTVIPSSWIT